MVTLKDVAKAANVSIPLVSKVLNNSLGNTRARPETIEHVRKVAAELGYQRNETAAALRSGRQNAIGIYVRRQGAESNSMIEAMLDGIASVCEPVGLRQNLAFYNNAEGFRKLKARIRPNLLDGIIICGFTSDELAGDLVKIQQQGIKVITIFGSQIHPDIFNIGNDSMLVGKIAAEHLISRGCRRIAHLCHTTPANKFIEQRHIGYKKALQEAGITVDSSLILETEDFSFASGYQAAKKLLSDRIKFDGIVADSDPQAMGAMRALSENGIKVPGQVRVVGVDNSPFCEFGLVTLSSISADPAKRGKIAAENLIKLIKGEESGSVIINPVLCERESSQ